MAEISFIDENGIEFFGNDSSKFTNGLPSATIYPGYLYNQSTYSPTNLIDGNTSNFGHSNYDFSQTNPVACVIDLGVNPPLISKVKIYNRVINNQNSLRQLQYFQLIASNDSNIDRQSSEINISDINWSVSNGINVSTTFVSSVFITEENIERHNNLTSSEYFIIDYNNGIPIPEPEPEPELEMEIGSIQGYWSYSSSELPPNVNNGGLSWPSLIFDMDRNDDPNKGPNGNEMTMILKCVYNSWVDGANTSFINIGHDPLTIPTIGTSHNDICFSVGKSASNYPNAIQLFTRSHSTSNNKQLNLYNHVVKDNIPLNQSIYLVWRSSSQPSISSWGFYIYSVDNSDNIVLNDSEEHDAIMLVKDNYKVHMNKNNTTAQRTRSNR